MRHHRTLGVVATLSLLSLAPAEVEAGAVSLPGPGGTVFNVPVTSFQERKFERVVPQAFDFSCGSAAVATLLTYHLDQPRTERDIFVEMYETGDQEKIREKGFSLLDMKRYLEQQGYKADGFRIDIDKLREVAIPAIALVDTNGYSHFVVVKGVDESAVILGDPALGIRTLSRDEFEKMWNGIFFVVHNRMSIAQKHFNQAVDWERYEALPLDRAISRTTLAEFTLSLPVRPHDY